MMNKITLLIFIFLKLSFSLYSTENNLKTVYGLDGLRLMNKGEYETVHYLTIKAEYDNYQFIQRKFWELSFPLIIKELKKFKELKILTLSKFDEGLITDSDIKELTKVNNIQSIVLRDCFGDYDLKYGVVSIINTKFFSKLQMINRPLFNNERKDVKSTKLLFITGDCYIDKDGELNSLEGLSSYQKVEDIFFYALSDTSDSTSLDLEVLKSLPNLKSVSIKNCSFTKINVLSELTKLEELQLYSVANNYCAMGNQPDHDFFRDLSFFKNYKNLKRLSFPLKDVSYYKPYNEEGKYTGPSDFRPDLSPIRHCKKLEYLDLVFGDGVVDEFSFLKELPRLKTMRFVLNKKENTEKFFKTLSQLKLEEIFMEINCDLNVRCIEYLSKIKTLKFLHMGQSRARKNLPDCEEVTKKLNLDKLLNLENLKYLHVEYELESYDFVEKMPSLIIRRLNKNK